MTVTMKCEWCGAAGPFPGAIAVRTVTLNDYWAEREGKPTKDVLACTDTEACEARQAAAEDDRERMFTEAEEDAR